MKTITTILILIILLPLLGYSQVKPVHTVKIANSKTMFGERLPQGTLVLDMSTYKTYYLTHPSNANESIVTSGAATRTEPSGLELIPEIGNEGWRLIGWEQSSFGSIGNNAVDLSISQFSSSNHGATGDFSFASGNATIASGESSFASGVITTASGANSTATGKETTASGVSSFTSGEATTASNYYSTAMGYTTVASGSSSFATGNETSATGNSSFTMGEETTAQNTNQLSTGQYNVGTSLTTVFETGIGSSTTPKNAFEIHTDGKVWADHLEVAGHISVTNTGNSVFIGEFAGMNDDLSNNRNVFIGRYAGSNNTIGNYNNAFGHNALNNNTTGQSNAAFGSGAMEDNLTGTGNTAMGNSALYQVTTGDDNVAIGNQAMSGCGGTSSNNVAIGKDALNTNQYSNNVAIGYQAGRENMYGTGNIFIGYQAAQNLSTYGDISSNKLYIENSNSATPLIYGDFATDSLVINGDLTVTGRVVLSNNNVPFHHYATGEQGEIVYGEDYIYICIQPDEWKRVAISDW